MGELYRRFKIHGPMTHEGPTSKDWNVMESG